MGCPNPEAGYSLTGMMVSVKNLSCRLDFSVPFMRVCPRKALGVSAIGHEREVSVWLAHPCSKLVSRN